MATSVALSQAYLDLMADEMIIALTKWPEDLLQKLLPGREWSLPDHRWLMICNWGIDDHLMYRDNESHVDPHPV